MANVGVKLETDAGTIEKLAPGKREMWRAARHDGSDNRINGGAIAETATVSFSAAFVVAAFMGLKKKFRNRGKTKEDLAAEKEAAAINRTCDALSAMLLEYILSAREGAVDEENPDDMTGTLDEMSGFFRSGKLSVPDAGELTGLRENIRAFTEAIAEKKGAQTRPSAGTPDGDEFSLIREQLIRQRDLVFPGRGAS